MRVSAALTTLLICLAAVQATEKAHKSKSAAETTTTSTKKTTIKAVNKEHEPVDAKKSKTAAKAADCGPDAADCGMPNITTPNVAAPKAATPLPSTSSLRSSNSAQEPSFLSNLFSLAGIGGGDGKVGGIEKFEDSEEGEGHEEGEEGENDAASAYNYFAMWRYLQDGDCEDGATGGEYMVAFTGGTGDCKPINDLSYGIVRCGEDGTTYTAEYYQDDKCTQHTATFATDSPVDVCTQINGNTWKAHCSQTDLSKENPYMQCFAGSEMVHLESGLSIPMDQVRVGDRVQVVSSESIAEYADVVYLPHSKNSVEASFVNIEINEGTDSIRMTPDHLIMAGDCNSEMSLVAAKDVAIDQCVATVHGQDVVSNVIESRGFGVYTIVTSNADGMIVVNGFKASSFATNHFFANSYYNIHRAVYKYNIDLSGLNDLMTSIGMALSGIYSA